MTSTISIVPQPHSLSVDLGQFVLSKNTLISSRSELAESAVKRFQSTLVEWTGLRLQSGSPDSSTGIRLEEQSGLPAEAYTLKVSPMGIEIQAGDASGFSHALTTLLQLLPLEAPAAPGEWSIPAVTIRDQPRFGWRGMLLDSSRYFQPVAWIKRFLDLMALHKLNVLHWHLTDDQGWRVEIDRFPELTTVSAWRKETRTGPEHESTESDFDGRPHGGFYTKAELRDIVAYASGLGITIVPEIEMPGHCQEVLAAYPNLSCLGGPFEVSTQWSIHRDVFCAGNNEVFRFLEAVLDEVLEIFPSEFIHIGGDECPKDRWKVCPKCQKRIADEGLADEDELQSWFVRHFDAYLRERGRRLVGYDEILEGGLAQNATVLSWRSEKGGIEAAKSGHDVIMMPQQRTYLDFYQSGDHRHEPLCIGGYLPLRRVYEYEPIPPELSPDEAQRILGGQGALWTEYMPRPDAIEYMAFPRVCALAERFWSPAETRDYAEFTVRLKRHLTLLGRLNVNYRTPRSRDGF